MDRDSFVARHLDEWERLDALAGQRRHDGAEVDELVRLYQRTSGHLSTARVRYEDTDLVLYLTRILSRANAVLSRPPSLSLARVRRGIGHAVPLALWQTRWAIAVVGVVFVGAALAATWWLATTPGAIDFAMPAEYRQYYVEEAFESYYSDGPAWLFAIRLFLNNGRIALQMFGAGVLLGLPTLLISATNGWMVGVAGSVMADAGQAWTFWRLILPHGLVELPAIIVAGGAGLQVGWAVISPGDRTRTRAVAEEGRRAATVAFTAAAALVLAAAIEAWITPSALPDVVRIAIGAAGLFAVFVGPMLLGRQLDVGGPG
ncbi:stage II sporulation protein M, partial [Salsipaludibacter albus]|uniref:stage II sporulation protein M n=1 Tax=Salsipaludibacter albus TaxID=2849650 RepID=UPI001EE42413